MVAEILELQGGSAKELPVLIELPQPPPNLVVPAVHGSFHPGGDRYQLDIWMHEAEPGVNVSPIEGLVEAAHDLDVLPRHRLPSIPPTDGLCERSSQQDRRSTPSAPTPASVAIRSIQPRAKPDYLGASALIPGYWTFCSTAFAVPRMPTALGCRGAAKPAAGSTQRTLSFGWEVGNGGGLHASWSMPAL